MMSIPSAIAAGLIIAFSLAGILVCVSFPIARGVMKRAAATKGSFLVWHSLFLAIILFRYHDRYPWLCVVLLALLVLNVVFTAIYRPRVSRH